MNFLQNIWKTITKDPNLGGRVLLGLLVVAILFAAIALSGPKPEEEYFTTPTALPTALTSSPQILTTTPLPSPEYVPTNGVIVAVATVLMVVLIGTLIQTGIRKRPK